MCVVVCMLDCRFVSIHMCMCPNVHLNFCICVHVHVCIMFVYIVCDTVYVRTYPVELVYQKGKCTRICHMCTLPLICAQLVIEVN